MIFLIFFCLSSAKLEVEIRKSRVLSRSLDADLASSYVPLLQIKFRMLLFSLLVISTNALFFEMSEKETKCFIEELPDDTIVHGKYRTQVKSKDSDTYEKTAPGMGMHVEIKDPEKKVTFLLENNFGL